MTHIAGAHHGDESRHPSAEIARNSPGSQNHSLEPAKIAMHPGQSAEGLQDAVSPRTVRSLPSTNGAPTAAPGRHARIGSH